MSSLLSGVRQGQRLVERCNRSFKALPLPKSWNFPRALCLATIFTAIYACDNDASIEILDDLKIPADAASLYELDPDSMPRSGEMKQDCVGFAAVNETLAFHKYRAQIMPDFVVGESARHKMHNQVAMKLNENLERFQQDNPDLETSLTIGDILDQTAKLLSKSVAQRDHDAVKGGEKTSAQHKVDYGLTFNFYFNELIDGNKFPINHKGLSLWGMGREYTSSASYTLSSTDLENTTLSQDPILQKLLSIGSKKVEIAILKRHLLGESGMILITPQIGPTLFAGSPVSMSDPASAMKIGVKPSEGNSENPNCKRRSNSQGAQNNLTP